MDWDPVCACVWVWVRGYGCLSESVCARVPALAASLLACQPASLPACLPTYLSHALAGGWFILGGRAKARA